MFNQDQVKVTVIIPVYNTYKYITRCLNSITAQILSDIEIICVDDGSTDGSLELLHKIAERDRRISILEISNSGPGKARNLALTKATGKYIAYIDSDDHIHKRMLFDMYSAAEKNKVDIVACSIRKFSEDNQKFGRCSYNKILSIKFKNKAFTWEDLKEKIFELRFVCMNKLYRKDFLIESKSFFLENVFFEDMPFFYNSMLKAKKIFYIDKAYYNNLRLRKGATTFEQSNREIGIITAFKKVSKLLESDYKFEILKPHFEAFMISRLIEKLHRNDKDNIAEYYYEIKKHVMECDFSKNHYISQTLKKKIEIIENEDLIGYLTYELNSVNKKLAYMKRVIKSPKNIVKYFFKRGYI